MEDISVSYNQIRDCIIFGTSSGFFIYTITPFKKSLTREINGGVSIARMLNRSNVILIIGKNTESIYKPNKLVLWDDLNKKIVCDIEFRDNILNAEMNEDLIVVATSSNVFIYKFDKIELINKSPIQTPINVKGIFAMTYKTQVHTVCTLGNKVGSVDVYKIKKNGNSNSNSNDFDMNHAYSIQAHQNSIDNIIISRDGNYVATSSERGTLIRIFKLNQENTQIGDVPLLIQKPIKELRRGADPAHIVSMDFSDDNEKLVVGSSKGTVHLFWTGIHNKNNNLTQLNTQTQNYSDDSSSNDKEREKENTKIKTYGINYLKNYLPSYFDSEWSYSQFYLKENDMKLMFLSNNQIICIGKSGNYYEMEINDNKLNVTKTIQYYSDENDPFSTRTNTIK